MVKRNDEYRTWCGRGGGGGGGLVGRVMKFHENCFVGYCVHFVLRCKSAAEDGGGGGVDLKDETEVLRIVTWLRVFCCRLQALHQLVCSREEECRVHPSLGDRLSLFKHIFRCIRKCDIKCSKGKYSRPACVTATSRHCCNELNIRNLK
jgi:hypothetical protein